MADHGPESRAPSRPEPRHRDSEMNALWRSIRALFARPEPDQTLRAQIEEAIDEHEGDQTGDEAAANPQGDLSPTERQMLRNLLHFSEHDADDVAVPRGEIVAIAADATFDQLIAAFAEHGHSRMPVYRETLDDVVGMVLMKDVFPLIAGIAAGDGAPPDDWTRLMRQPLFVPQARPALDVLADMRASRTHLAIVVDEYSGTDGIVTIEDLVEEIIGNIEDEHDEAPEDLLRQLSDEIWEADARVELDEVAKRIDPRLSEVEEDIDTLGGLAVVLAGHVPQLGEIAEHPSGWRLEVVAGNDRRVERLRLHAPAGPEAEEED